MESKSEIVEKRIKPTVIRRRAKVEAPAPEPVATEPEVPAKVETKAQKPATAVLTPPSLPLEEKTKPVAPISVPPVVVKPATPVVRGPTIIRQPVTPPATHPISTPPPAPEEKPVSASPVLQVTPRKVQEVEDDRPRLGLRVVGRIELPQRTPPPSRGGAARPGNARPDTKPAIARPGVGTPLVPGKEAPLTPSEEEARRLKKVAKKSKREEIEVGLEGIDKVATLTQLTRMASTITTPNYVERERVFEPSRSGRKRKGVVRREGRKTELTIKKASKRIIKMGETIIVGDLAHEMSVKVGEVIKKLMGMGSMVTMNQPIDFDTASIIAHDFGYEVKKDIFEENEILASKADKDEDLILRPPVVTVMGHVDHGKTSLLDGIRKTQVASGEAGGITQHIGAYRVEVEKGSITFIDTPGHAAFTAMRARGASVTDIVILVVAADDGVMPQTIEAIDHARAAEVPIIVAVNKIDKPEADIDRIRRQLSEHQLLSEDWGGDTIFSYVSAKSGQGISELLEMILLQAEVMELKANPNKSARAIVVESRLDRGRGPVATLLVQEGTLRVGDSIVAGVHFGRVRGMRDDQGHELTEAGPSDAVELIGLSGVPNAGEIVYVVNEEGVAKLVAENRENREKAQKQAAQAKTTLEDLFGQIQRGEAKELRMVLKGDVQGSVEALRESLGKLSTDKVRLNILHTGVGGITESDVMLASASNAIVVGFNVRPEMKAQETARSENVQIKVYEIIYNVIEDVKKAMEGLLAPTLNEKYLGRAEIRQVFNITKVGSVGGAFVIDGSINRNCKVRLLRDNKIVYTGKLSTLKRFKEDAKEVQQGYECGLTLENFNDIKAGDVVEAFNIETVATKL